MRITVIIPALNEAQAILGSLESVTRQQGEFEIIVVDGQSADGTADIARRHARVIRSASGEALVFLHADSCLPRNALSMLRSALADPDIAGGTFTLRFDSPQFLLRLIAFFTRFRFRFFHYGDQGIFVRRAVFEELGGFKQMPLMEDIDFLRRMRKRGRVTLVRAPVTTSARRFLRHGIIRQQMLDILLVVLFLLGVSPEALSKLYGRTSR